MIKVELLQTVDLEVRFINIDREKIIPNLTHIYTQVINKNYDIIYDMVLSKKVKLILKKVLEVYLDDMFLYASNELVNYIKNNNVDKKKCISDYKMFVKELEGIKLPEDIDKLVNKYISDAYLFVEYQEGRKNAIKMLKTVVEEIKSMYGEIGTTNDRVRDIHEKLLDNDDLSEEYIMKKIIYRDYIKK